MLTLHSTVRVYQLSVFDVPFFLVSQLSAKRGSSGSAGLKPSLGAHPHARNSLPTADGSASRASTLSPVVVAGGEVGGDGKVALMRISAGPHGPTMSAAVPRRRHQLIGPAVDIQMIILLCSVTAVFSYCWGQYIVSTSRWYFYVRIKLLLHYKLLLVIINSTRICLHSRNYEYMFIFMLFSTLMLSIQCTRVTFPLSCKTFLFLYLYKTN